MPNTTAAKSRTRTKTSSKPTAKSHTTTSTDAEPAAKRRGRGVREAAEIDAPAEPIVDATATGDAAAEQAPVDEVVEKELDQEIEEEVATLAEAARASNQGPDEAEVTAIWTRYKKQPGDEDRNTLIVHYLHLVKYTAERLHARLPGEVDVEDLMSAGLFGLMDAIDNFDPQRGVKFETYCSQRVRGAIYDELRAMDWVPRLVRSRTAKVEKARKALEMELGRSATDQELINRLGVKPEEYAKLDRDSRPVGVVSLDRKWFETDSSKDVREIDVIKDNRQTNPVQEIARQDLKVLLTKGLSRAERLIVVLYYYEEMTMKEIGTTLDLSESRVSQMHSSIMARLKVQMQHRTKDV